MKTGLMKSMMAATLLAAAMATPAKGHVPEECKVEVEKVDEVRERMRQHFTDAGLMGFRHNAMLEQKTREVMVTVIGEVYDWLEGMIDIASESTKKVDGFAKCVARNGG